MKKSVTQFDLSAAFKALDEMEYPKVEGGILPNRIDLRESFGNRKLRTDVLIEDYYDVNDTNDLEAAADEREAEIAKAKLARIEKIVDLDADSEDDLLTSYEGKVIIQCPQCMTLFYKDEKDLEVDENSPDVVNINETCQHCGNTSGYMVIGKVAPVDEAELDNFDTEDFEEEPAEGTEEVEETEGTEEDENIDDLDVLDLDFEEEPEETKEEETNESLNKAEIQKEVDKKHCSENDSENLTLNEDVNLKDTDQLYSVIFDNEAVFTGTDEECKKYIEDHKNDTVVKAKGKMFMVNHAIVPVKEDLKEDKGEAAAQDELQAEHEAPIEEAKKVCEKCGKEICECGKQELKESEIDDIINSVIDSWGLNEALDDDTILINYDEIKKACLDAKKAGKNCPYAGGKYKLFGIDKLYNTIITKEAEAGASPEKVKTIRDELLANNDDVIGVYVSRVFKNKEDNKTYEVALDKYEKFKPEYELVDDVEDEEEENWQAKKYTVEPLIKPAEEIATKILNRKGIAESLEEGINKDFLTTSKMGFKVKNLYQNDKGRLYVVVYRPKSDDYALGAGYDLTTGYWAQGYYDFLNPEDAVDYLFDKYSNENLKKVDPATFLVKETAEVEESLNKADVQKDVDKKHCAENDSENLTLNEAAEEEVVEDEVAEEPVEETEEVAEDETEVEETEEKEELPEVDFTTSEVKEVAEEVANAVAEPVEDEEAAEKQAEEIKEIVDEKVADAVEEKVETEEPVADEKQPAEETVEEVPAEEIVDETEVIEEPVEEAAELDEALKIIADISDYTPWSGAVDTFNKIKDAGKLDQLEEYLEECYPEGLQMVQLNDILWFDSEDILSYLGLAEDEEEDEDFDESLKEADNTSDEVSDAEFDKLVDSKEFDDMLNDPNALAECNINEVFENVDEADEKAFEECITEALCKTYENVKNFTLDECVLKDNKFIVEGTINFNSGKTRKTQYVFESAARAESKAILEGYNKALSEDGNFRINCVLKESCLVPQSMSYKYTIGEHLVEGLATRK